ncbi:protocadherin beta-15-like [Amia ocellicauda]|uniref:protocadherin beta-15-like n=1 Tax=Amia ocellicauda TaxID=2972642 RepID=UPI003464B1F8
MGNTCYATEWQVICIYFFLAVLHVSLGDFRYSVPEETKNRYIIGSLTHDFNLDFKLLRARRARVDYQGSRRYCDIHLDTGDFIVLERMDREKLCGQTSPCLIHFEFILESPLELHNIALEIQDINDNAPSFPKDVIKLEISETAPKGSRFQIAGARDPDVGVNSVKTYILRPNKHFGLDIHTSNERGKYGEIVLKSTLDREKEREHSLLLTAVDGGDPPRSGTVIINIVVLDSNDNAPVFLNALYKVSILENSLPGTFVAKVSATDKDEGANGEINYDFNHVSESTKQLFDIDSKSGEIKVIGKIDFEESASYEIEIQAEDGGGQAGHCRVLVQITDVNDNIPAIIVKSISNPIPENLPPGTEIAIINVMDQDSGENSKVTCTMSPNLPFKLQTSIRNYFTLVTEAGLDREEYSEYNVTVTATDGGSPSLSSSKILHLIIADINDNPPTFDQQSYSAYVTENNVPGSSISSVTARDPDWKQNGTVTYALLPSEVNGISVASIFSINRDSGVIHAVRSFDYEQLRSFKVHVVAKDNGSPQLSSNVTVSVFITDQNDNSPQILYPAQSGNSFMTEMVPKAAQAGSLVSKVIAVDADSGQNAWLSYQIVKSTDPGLFTIGVHSGEIRTQRDVSQSDIMKQNLIVLVKDNGQRSHSSTCTVNFVISDDYSDYTSEMKDHAARSENMSNTTAYLVIALAVVTFLFLVFITLILVVKVCRRGKPGLLFDGAVAIPSAHFPPNYAEVEGSGTLRHSYIYDTFLTTGSRTSDFKFVSSYDSTMPRDSTLKKEQKVSNEAGKTIGQEEDMSCEKSAEMQSDRSS